MVYFFIVLALLICSCGSNTTKSETTAEMAYEDACNSTEEQLSKRAVELCQYIPDHQLLEKSKDFMTEDFYAVLDTMFNLPEHEAMDHEWLHYFVTGNGGSIADFTVDTVELKDKTHAIALLSVRQIWEDGSFSAEEDVEEHRLYMEKVDGEWLISDFDEHKQDCINGIENWRKEEALRQAISKYLVSEIGSKYAQGDLCIPVLMIVATEEDDTNDANGKLSNLKCFGNFWVFNYNMVGDTLKTVSGGNHAGCMTMVKKDGALLVTAFEQTKDGAGNDASAKRIFGQHYDIYQNMHSNQDVREVVRQEQLQQYVQRHGLKVQYYQDYGREAVEI